MGSRAIRAALTVTCMLAVPGLAGAQYSQPLFLEAARDPGRAEPALTARALALGGVRSASGLADDAPVSPAMLLFESGTDIVASGGMFRLSREELVVTPSQVPPWDPARALTPWSGSPVGFVSVATRHAGWAVAGFYDGSGRSRHRFDAAPTTLAFAALQGTSFSYRGHGRASAAMSVDRVGGSLAVGSFGGRVGVGVSMYAVRLDYDVSGDVEVETWSKSSSDPSEQYRYTWFEHDGVRFTDTGAGLTLNAAVKPIPRVTIGARWNHEPRFHATRRLTVSGGAPPLQVTEDVQFQMPETWALSAGVVFGPTLVVSEVARTRYSDTFQPFSADNAFGGCSRLVSVYCDGWGFTTHRPADATTWRLGVEHRMAIGRSRLLLRAGLALEQAYWLSRSADDPARNGQSLPAPPIVSSDEPPRDAFTWFTGGAAFQWRAIEIGLGGGYASHQARLLVDARFRFR